MVVQTGEIQELTVKYRVLYRIVLKGINKMKLKTKPNFKTKHPVLGCESKTIKIKLLLLYVQLYQQNTGFFICTRI